VGVTEARWGRALPQIGKMRFGSCVGEVAFPLSSYQPFQSKLILNFLCNAFFSRTGLEVKRYFAVKILDPFWRNFFEPHDLISLLKNLYKWIFLFVEAGSGPIIAIVIIVLVIIVVIAVAVVARSQGLLCFSGKMTACMPSYFKIFPVIFKFRRFPAILKFQNGGLTFLWRLNLIKIFQLCWMKTAFSTKCANSAELNYCFFISSISYFVNYKVCF